MSDFNEKIVICPFFHSERNNTIICEGICRGTTVELRFSCHGNLKKHRFLFCDSHGYLSCPLFEAINQKYERK